MQTEVVIIGAGPAGVAAAVQLSRSGINFALLEKKSVGGLLNSASLVENFPGFPDGIGGGELAFLLASHLKKLKIKPLCEEVIAVDFKRDNFEIKTESNSIESKYLIAASGTRAIPVPVSVPPEIRNRVHSEILPLLGFSGLNVAVVGGGDAAFDYALNLSAENNVYILCRSSFSCLPLLYNRACACKKIEYFEEVGIDKLAPARDRVKIFYKVSGKNCDLSVDHVLFAIGREPNADYLKNLDLNDIGALQRKGRLFMCGDIKNGRARQAVIAAGEGQKAAMKIILNRGQ